MPSSKRFKNNTDHILIIKIGNRAPISLLQGEETSKMDYCGPDWVDSELIDEINEAEIYVEFPDNERILIETKGENIDEEEDSKSWWEYLYFNFSYHFCKRINQSHVQKVISEKKDKDKNRDAENLAALGTELFNKGQYQEALNNYELAANMTSDEKAEKIYKSFQLLAQAKIHLSNKEFIEAIKCCEDSMGLYKSDEKYNHLTVAFLRYGDYLLSEKEHNEAIHNYEEAKKVAKSDKQKEECEQKLATAYSKKAKKDSKKKCIDAEKLAALGTELFNKEQYQEALENYERAAKMTSDKKAGKMYNSFKLLAQAKIHLCNKEFAEAIKCCEDSMELYKSDGNCNHLAVAFLRHGDYLLSEKNHSEAISNYGEAKKAAKSDEQKEECEQKLVTAYAEKAKEEQEVKAREQRSIMDNSNLLEQHEITGNYNLKENSISSTNTEEPVDIDKNSNINPTDTEESPSNEAENYMYASDYEESLSGDADSDIDSIDTDKLSESDYTQDDIESEKHQLKIEIQDLYSKISNSKTEKERLDLMKEQKQLIFQYNNLFVKNVLASPNLLPIFNKTKHNSRFFL